MIDVKNLVKISDILNSEGAILALYNDSTNNLYLHSFLKDSMGNVYYSINSEQLIDYLSSKLTLKELYEKSQSFLVKHEFRKEFKTFLKDDFINSLQCGSDYYMEKTVKLTTYFRSKLTTSFGAN